MDQINKFLLCFEETFGFNAPDSEEFTDKKDEEKLPIYRYAEYPENFYIPTNQYENACSNISLWKKLRYTPYKRISHFREHLNRLQGCQFISIPDKIIRLVKKTVEENTKGETQLYFIVKEVLRKNKGSQFNEHIHYLISDVQKQYLKITYEDYRSLCKIFQELEVLFNKRKTGFLNNFFEKRKNLISYYLIVQLLLYLFHYHPRYALPTLYDENKRQEYYILLLGLIQSCVFGPQLLEEHFRRKKTCPICQSYNLNLGFDQELLKLI
jgi:hypothetical protein